MTYILRTRRFSSAGLIGRVVVEVLRKKASAASAWEVSVTMPCFGSSVGEGGVAPASRSDFFSPSKDIAVVSMRC